MPNRHTVPQAPQLNASRDVSTSHPVDTIRSQSARSRAQAPTAHAPLVHTGVALGVLHVVPHSPQLATLVRTLVSHPSSGSRLQFAKPAAHAMLHRPAAHIAVPLVELQTSPQAPQLRGSVLVLTSHPLAAFASQLPKPAAHAVTVQADDAHPAVALASEHTRPQLPQCAALDVTSTHAPEQSVVPIAQVDWHVPLLHTFPAAHTVPHAPQLRESSRTLASHPLATLPSQLP